MNYVLLEFIPLLLGAAVAPVPIIIVLLLLQSAGGTLKALAFLGGIVLVRLIQGIAFGFLLSSSEQAQTEAGSDSIVSIILLILGILLWIAAFKKWQKEEDPDAPPPRWMSMFASVTALKAFGLGAGIMLIAAKQWVFTLGALSVINEADLSSPDNTIAYLLFILGATSLMLVPILLSIVAPHRAAKLLQSTSQWLERNNRPLTIAVSAIFGTYFIFLAITGLLGYYP